MSGKIYDTNEANRMTEFLNKQEEQFKAIENEKGIVQKTILKYSILAIGAVGVLLTLNFIISKRAKK